MNSEVAYELDLLLNNYWIVKEDRPKDYYRIKNKLKELRELANNKLGCDIYCNNKLIKLEKIPISTDTYKIEEFDKQVDYVIFICLLLFLEDKGLDDQFILSNFTEFTTNILAGIPGDIKPDWKRYKDRKSVVDVLKYATDLKILRLRDGNDAKYADDETYEVLYENTGLSHYVLRNYKFDVFTCKTPEDFLIKEKEALDSLNYKRYIIYRGLFYYPSIIFDELDKEASQYLKNMRYRINEDVEKILESELIMTKNTAFISMEGTKDRDLFPNMRKSISDIVLLFHTYLWKEERNIENDKIKLNKLEFRNILMKVHEENKEYFSKEYREAPLPKFISQVVAYMSEFKLLKETEEYYIINPVTCLIKGIYPRIKEEKEEENYEILSFNFDE